MPPSSPLLQVSDPENGVKPEYGLSETGKEQAREARGPPRPLWPLFATAKHVPQQAASSQRRAGAAPPGSPRLLSGLFGAAGAPHGRDHAPLLDALFSLPPRFPPPQAGRQLAERLSAGGQSADDLLVFASPFSRTLEARRPARRADTPRCLEGKFSLRGCRRRFFPFRPSRRQTAQCVCDSVGVPHSRIVRRPRLPPPSSRSPSIVARRTTPHGAVFSPAGTCCIPTALFRPPQATAPELRERFFGAAMEKGPHRCAGACRLPVSSILRRFLSLVGRR